MQIDEDKQIALNVSPKIFSDDNFLEKIKVDTTQPAWVDEFGEILGQISKKSLKGRKIRTLSLFSGAGGLDIGFHQAGFDIVEMVEIEQKFTKTLEENTKTGAIFEGSKACTIDIRDYKSKDLGKIDFIIGGPPCQTFSAAGRRAAGVKGIEDPRGMLFKEYVRLLGELQPKAFLFENVYAIVGAQGGKPWELIIKSFNEAGYHLFYRVLDAADYGAPQHRERLIIVGVKDHKLDFKFPAPTHGPDSRLGLPYYSAGQALGDFRDDNGASLGGQYGHLLKDIPPGLNYSFYTKKMGHPAPVFGWRSKFSDFLYKADPSMPVRAIKAQGGKYTGPFSWNSRPFTVPELKRLQTFPDNFELVGGRGVAIHQIGNSVPPQFARMLALSVITQIFDCNLPFKVPLLKPSDKLSFRTRKRQLTRSYQLTATNAIAKLKKVDAKPITFKKRKPFYLDYKLSLSTGIKDGIKVYIESIIDNDTWVIKTFKNEKSTADEVFVAKTEIVSSKTESWPFGFETIRLEIEKDDLNHYLAGWKFIEAEIKECLGYADLVQFAGYYQYSPTIKITTALSEDLEGQVIWKLIQSFGKKSIIGVEQSIEDLVSIIGEKPSVIEEAMKKLKTYGYEIRNKNTNPQIQEGHYIIPYAFPTLTSRKVQYAKAL